MPRAGPLHTATRTDVHHHERCVRWEGKKTTARTWHHFSLIQALLWILGVLHRLCLLALCGHEQQPLIPGWHRFLPFAVALRHKEHCKCLAVVLRNTSTLGSWSSCILIPGIWKPLVLLKWRISELAFPHNHRYFKNLAKQNGTLGWFLLVLHST